MRYIMSIQRYRGLFPPALQGKQSPTEGHISLLLGRPESIAGPPYDRDKLKAYTLFGKIKVAGRIK